MQFNLKLLIVIMSFAASNLYAHEKPPQLPPEQLRTRQAECATYIAHLAPLQKSAFQRMNNAKANEDREVKSMNALNPVDRTTLKKYHELRANWIAASHFHSLAMREYMTLNTALENRIGEFRKFGGKVSSPSNKTTEERASEIAELPIVNPTKYEAYVQEQRGIDAKVMVGGLASNAFTLFKERSEKLRYSKTSIIRSRSQSDYALSGLIEDFEAYSRHRQQFVLFLNSVGTRDTAVADVLRNYELSSDPGMYKLLSDFKPTNIKGPLDPDLETLTERYNAERGRLSIVVPEAAAPLKPPLNNVPTVDAIPAASTSIVKPVEKPVAKEARFVIELRKGKNIEAVSYEKDGDEYTIEAVDGKSHLISAGDVMLIRDMRK